MRFSSTAPCVKFCCMVGSHGGSHVEVEGSFDNWTTRQPMQRSGKDFTIVKLLPSGVYQVDLLQVHALWMYRTAGRREMFNCFSISLSLCHTRSTTVLMSLRFMARLPESGMKTGTHQADLPCTVLLRCCCATVQVHCGWNLEVCARPASNL